MALPSWAEATGDQAGFSSRSNAVSGGIIYNVIATIFQIIGSLVSVLIFARLLSVEDFGVFGMISPIIGILVMFADGGTVYYTLRRPKIEESSVSFNFWYCTVIGAVLMLAMVLVAPVLALVMGEPRLWSSGLVMGLVLVFSSLGCQHLALSLRCFRNDIRTWCIVISTTGSILLGIVVALAGGGYWALVAVAVGRAVLQTLSIYVITGWVPLKPHWDRAELRDILRLSNAELVSRVTLTAVREADRIAVGILFATATVGYYSLAYLLSIAPLLQLMTPLFFVIVPYLAEMRGQGERFIDGVRLMVMAFLYLLLPGAIYAGVHAEELLGFVVGMDKIQTADVFPIMILTAVMYMMISAISLAFQSSDRPDLTRRYNFWMLPLVALALLLAMPAGTPQAIAGAVLVASILAAGHRLCMVLRYLERDVLAELRQILPVLSMAIIVGLGCSATTMALLPMMETWPAVLRFLAVLLIFGVIWAVAGMLLFRSELRLVFRPGVVKQEPAE